MSLKKSFFLVSSVTAFPVTIHSDVVKEHFTPFVVINYCFFYLDVIKYTEGIHETVSQICVTNIKMINIHANVVLRFILYAVPKLSRKKTV